MIKAPSPIMNLTSTTLWFSATMTLQIERQRTLLSNGGIGIVVVEFAISYRLVGVLIGGRRTGTYDGLHVLKAQHLIMNHGKSGLDEKDSGLPSVLENKTKGRAERWAI